VKTAVDAALIMRLRAFLRILLGCKDSEGYAPMAGSYGQYVPIPENSMTDFYFCRQISNDLGIL
jgi:hypothetical protein